MKKQIYKIVLVATAEVLTRLPYTKKRSLILDKLLVKVES